MIKIMMPFTKGDFKLKNHLVMAPMTRSRAIGNLPNHLMTEYYAQRTGAGLIITEGTSPTADGLGYPRIPGIFSRAQIDGWKEVTEAVHAGNSKIFLQIMHTGRIGHIDNLPGNNTVRGASAIRAAGQIFTDTKGLQDHSDPIPLQTHEVRELVASHVLAAENAMAAGFDGIELHGANGYLIEQFLNPNVNTRTDEYGGSIRKRAKLAIDLATEIADAIGRDKVAIRFSPYSTGGDLKPYAEQEVHDTYEYLAGKFNKTGIVYIHLGITPGTRAETTRAIRNSFDGTIVLCNGLTPDTGEAALNEGIADLVAFGRAFLANPDFDKRIEQKANLNGVDIKTLYTAGAAGYTDYPVLNDRDN